MAAKNMIINPLYLVRHCMRRQSANALPTRRTMNAVEI